MGFKRAGAWSLVLVAVLFVSWQAPQDGSLVAAQRGPDARADCNILWNEILHDTFSPDYRSPGGPATPGTTIRLRLRVAQGDITSARLRVWDDRTNLESYHALAWDSGFDHDSTTYDWWYVDLDVGSQPTILYYFFEINDEPAGCADQDFYVDDEVKFYGGGYGAVSDDYNDQKSFQITVYDPAFAVPAWLQRGVIYQVFPDRFRDGDAGNNPASGRFFYGSGSSIVRSNSPSGDWNSVMCDPRGVGSPACAGHYSDNFYGGDLQGLVDKIEQGYFDSLGVTVLYLNPIFRSPSNHKYDTADYLAIDPDFGSLATFQALAAAANSHGIRIILDGVFNHTSSDSMYFDYYSRYDAGGAPHSGNDSSGACEAAGSSFASWFYLPAATTPACDAGHSGDPNACEQPADLATCRPPGYGGASTYEAWYGYPSLPKLQANSAPVRDLIWAGGLDSVAPYWVGQGARGWRFDVGGDVDSGLTNDTANSYWEGLRAAVRSVSADTVTLGEEWGDGSPWLLGNEWDSVMNYRFRSAVLSWLFTGCTGSGCAGGAVFEDNDSNAGSSSGAIGYISPSQFNARLRSIQEDYPPPAFKGMMNLEGSHDTNRLRFLLKKINNDNDGAAVQRMKEWWLFAFTYAGAPTLYYGDEVGLSHDGVWANNKWEDDPYNRAPYPWPDASGTSYGADTTNLQPFARTMASIRHSYRALQDGDVQHGLVIDDGQKLYGFARTGSGQTALVALNRDGTTHTATFTNLNASPYNLADGAVLVEALGGSTYTVSGGSVSVPVNPTWGAILLERDKIDVPQAPAGLSVSPAGADVTLTWPAVTRDANNGRETVTHYSIHRSTDPAFTPGAGNQIATVAPPSFGSAGGALQYTDPGAGRQSNSYAVCAHNGNPAAPGPYSCAKPVPTGLDLVSFTARPVLGSILVTWETSTGTGTAGFDLYRGEAADGVYTRLNQSLIPGPGADPPSGAVYRWLDASVRSGVTYYYRLARVDVQDVSWLHGPVSARARYAFCPPFVCR